jgi:hypothetical protein
MKQPETPQKHHRVAEVATLLGVSPKTVRRQFEDRPGVRFIGNKDSTKKKRRYGMLLIPDNVLQEYLAEIGSL